MYTTRFFPIVCAFIICAFLFTPSAHAQTAQRTFVSTQGNDANTASLCGRNAPCRGFTAAISVVAAGGEVVALDSGGYGAVTISKSVQLAAPTGVYAAITATSGNAITVNAGGSDVVVLRGLTLNGLGTGINGIDWNTGAVLHIESCTINGFSNTGIFFNAAGKLFVKDIIVRNGGLGIEITADSGTATASIDGCRVENNTGSGILASQNARVTVSRAIVANNGNHGFAASGGGQMTLESCIARGNTNVGMRASNTGTVLRVANSVATENATGFSQESSAIFRSRGNNTVDGNTTNVQGTLTSIFGT